MQYIHITHDHPAQNAFVDLIQTVFHFSFQPWIDRNLWNERYQTHSIIENDRLLSNISVMRMQLLVNGQSFETAQIGGVCTLPEFRGQGLSGTLMRHVLEEYSQPLFLFANDSVTEFYPRFGFERHIFKEPFLPIAPTVAEGDLVPLTSDAFLDQCLKDTRKSSILDCIDSETVQRFHCLISYPNQLTTLPDRPVLVVCERNDDKLTLIEVAGNITWTELVSHLPLTGVRKIVFGFPPDRLDVPNVQWRDNEELCFVRGWKPPEYGVFSLMMMT